MRLEARTRATQVVVAFLSPALYSTAIVLTTVANAHDSRSTLRNLTTNTDKHPAVRVALGRTLEGQPRTARGTGHELVTAGTRFSAR